MSQGSHREAQRGGFRHTRAKGGATPALGQAQVQGPWYTVADKGEQVHSCS